MATASRLLMINAKMKELPSEYTLSHVNDARKRKITISANIVISILTKNDLKKKANPIQ